MLRSYSPISSYCSLVQSTTPSPGQYALDKNRPLDGTLIARHCGTSTLKRVPQILLSRRYKPPNSLYILPLSDMRWHIDPQKPSSSHDMVLELYQALTWSGDSRRRANVLLPECLAYDQKLYEVVTVVMRLLTTAYTHKVLGVAEQTRDKEAVRRKLPMLAAQWRSADPATFLSTPAQTEAYESKEVLKCPLGYWTSLIKAWHIRSADSSGVYHTDSVDPLVLGQPSWPARVSKEVYCKILAKLCWE